MNHFLITGIQQVGVGTVDMRQSWNWYIKMFGIDVKILEDDTVAERMLPYTGGVPQQRHACISISLQGGGGFEIWQYSKRKPVEPLFEVGVGDFGIFAAKLKCRNVTAFHDEIAAKWHEYSAVSSLPDGTLCMYVRDLYGNFFQIVESNDVFIEQHRLTGGMVGGLIGVSDMETSLCFYRDVFGYDEVVYDKTGSFADWRMLPGGDAVYRRVLLKSSAKEEGAFSGLLTKGMIELVQSLDRQPRKIYDGRYWGDPGFIQLCYDVTNMKALSAHCKELGYPFTVDSCPGDVSFDMGDASGHFTYIEDPDGTLIEFVETHRIPVVKKLGWYINLLRRDRKKPLPRFLFRMMGLVSREKSKE